MCGHFIILASAYSIGKRIVLHYTSQDLENGQIKKDMQYIEDRCGKDVTFSTHFIQTNSNDYESVIELDKFFENTKVIDTKEEFVKLLLKDQDLKSLDVARYILASIPCTHLKLEKLTYLCYAEYLCKENKKLFNDKIFTYRLGPVIDSVYQKYKKSSNDMLEEDDFVIYDESKIILPIQSRILASKDGFKKLIVIEETLKKYGNYKASELVDITHNPNTPWYIANELNKKEITDDLILKYHKNEIN